MDDRGVGHCISCHMCCGYGYCVITH